MSEADWDAVLDVNLKSMFNTIKACYRNFMKKKAGRIINVSSVSGLTGNAYQANYASSKVGVVGLTKTVAKELASRHITCNAIAPGAIRTPMTDAMDPKDLQAILTPFPWASWARARTSRNWRPSWPATRPSISPAKSSAWMAASPCNCDSAKKQPF